MTNDELMRFYIPKNTPREPSEDKINSILNSGIEDPVEYILAHFCECVMIRKKSNSKFLRFCNADK